MNIKLTDRQITTVRRADKEQWQKAVPGTADVDSLEELIQLNILSWNNSGFGVYFTQVGNLILLQLEKEE